MNPEGLAFGRRGFEPVWLRGASLGIGTLGIGILLFAGCFSMMGKERLSQTNSNRFTNRGPNIPLPTYRASPVDFFRELLAMTPAERKNALTNRPPENRKAILAKVREYQALKPEQREWRLKATELRWYLGPLMRSPSTNRESQLANIPEEDRQMVADHIRQWDALPAAAQKEILQHQDTIRYLLYTEVGSSPLASGGSSTNLSQARVKKLEQGVQEWQGLPEERRQELMARFNQFFELSPTEKQKALNTLSEAERRQIEKTLKAFNGLTPSQRAQCLRSFEKFAGMSLYERQQFLKNAEKWKLMKPEERAAWKNIVEFAPLSPPTNAYIKAPLPPKIVPRRPPAVATNGG